MMVRAPGTSEVDSEARNLNVASSQGTPLPSRTSIERFREVQSSLSSGSLRTGSRKSVSRMREMRLSGSYFIWSKAISCREIGTGGQ